jgi:hypothetical protein
VCKAFGRTGSAFAANDYTIWRRIDEPAFDWFPVSIG